MDAVARHRVVMAGLGLTAGVCLNELPRIVGRSTTPGWPLATAVVFALVFFAGLLGMTGPLRALRAAAGAMALALVVAVLFATSAWRYDSPEAFATTAPPVLAAVTLALLPLPFLIAAGRPGGWRDYPTLFSEAWSLVLRVSAGWVFAGIVWLLLWLSHLLLSVVGIELVGRLLRLDVAMPLVTGLALGLGLAVSQEFDRLLSAWLPLRLLRLLVPALLAVMVVFVVALPLRGLTDGVMTGVSATATLLAMVAVAAVLIAAAVDADDAEAVRNPLMQHATRILAAVLPVPAAMGVWGLWLRVAERGWTPDRLFVAIVAVLALGYGIACAVGVLQRGAGWMAHLRRVNLGMACAVLAAAALWLSPLLNAQAISAGSQLGRFERGEVTVAALDIAAFRRWGPAGRTALAKLDRIAAQPGHEDLAARLVPVTQAVPEDKSLLSAGLAARLPLQPATATATRDMLLDGLPAWQIRALAEGCAGTLADGLPACVMVVADLWPDVPGEEAIVAMLHPGGRLELTGLGLRDGRTLSREVETVDGAPLPSGEAATRLIAAWQAAPPALSAARLNQIAGPEGAGLILRP